jgi:hypothetical protein
VNCTPVYSRNVCAVVQHPYMSAPMVGFDGGDVGAEWKVGRAARAWRL